MPTKTSAAIKGRGAAAGRNPSTERARTSSGGATADAAPAAARDAPAPAPNRFAFATVRVLWSLGAALLGGLTLAFLTVALTLGEAHAAILANSARTGAAADLSWTAMTDAPYLQTLFYSVWACAGGALFLLLTRPRWRDDRPSA